MREPPPHVMDAEVLTAVRRDWDERVDALEHLPVGFGAHHWRATVDEEPRLFVTFDRLLPIRRAGELEAAYAAAAELARRGQDFVLASIAARRGGRTVPLADGALSVTPWTCGRSGDGPPTDADEAAACAAMLARLHACRPPRATPRWRPLLDPAEFVPALTRRLDDRWDAGPYGERVRTALLEHLDDIRSWASAYGALARDAVAAPDTWVPTHGEPDTGNQLITAHRRLLVGWESLKLAPRERDLRFLVTAGLPWQSAYPHDLERSMVEMFDLEWRLDEVGQYAAWFSGAHTGTRSDAVAFAGLMDELTRAPVR